MENNQNNKKENNRNIFRDSKFLIDQNIYKFLLALMRVIFIQNNKTTKTRKALKILNGCIEKVNIKIIGKEKNLEHLSLEYTPKNLRNIINFVKIQNSLFYSEILENLLIIVFGMAFKAEKENIFGKFLYNNMDQLKKSDNYILDDWFNQQKFNSKILEEVKEARNSYIKTLLVNDPSNETNIGGYTKAQKNIVLFSFLKDILEGKLLGSDKKENLSKETALSPYVSISYYTSIKSNLLYTQDIGSINKVPINLARSLLISVYIYCQIKNSPLMKFIKESDDNKELEVLPYVYDLSESVIESDYSNIIFAPVRIEPRIEEIKMYKIFMRGKSCFEFSKALLFNQNIKKIDFHTTIIKSYYIKCIEGLNSFNNNSVEELNLSFNYLKEDSCQTLEYIISHFKKLKTLNLSSNDLKLGISPLLITLKNLYRKGETNLENLYLNNCQLDDIAFYELGELLKSKYCKLKKLYLNQNNIPSNSNFLKKLKKNKFLTEIYFSKDNIGNSNTDDVMRVISNSHLDYLYLNKNKISNFDQCLRILFRTKLVKTDGEKDASYHNPYFYNLDLSYNNCHNKNINKLKLFEKGIKDTQVYCLGFSQILLGLYPEKFNKESEYKKKVEKLAEILQEEEKDYKNTCFNININKVNKNKIGNIEYEEHFKGMDDEINNIINSKKSQFPVFIRKQALNLIKDHLEIFSDVKNEIKKVHSNLMKYINLKKSELELKKLEIEKNKKKMILI